MLALIAAAKSAAAPAARPRRSKQRVGDGRHGVADEGTSGDDGDDEDAHQEQPGEEDEDTQEEAGTDGDDVQGAEAAPAEGPAMQTFVFSATLTLPQALRRRLQKRARRIVLPLVTMWLLPLAPPALV